MQLPAKFYFELQKKKKIRIIWIKLKYKLKVNLIDNWFNYPFTY